MIELGALSALAQKLRDPLRGLGFHHVDGSRDLGRGPVFPAPSTIPGGLQTDDRFYRTDLNWPCFYDAASARWYTDYEFSANPTPNPLAVMPVTTVPNDVLFAPMRTDFTILVTRIRALAYVQATNNASNYWQILFRSAAGNNIWLFDTSDATVGQLWPYEITNNVVYSANYYVFHAYAKVGSPGPISLWGAFWYRIAF